MPEEFWNDLYEGEIHVRDNYQFELKSEFFINPLLKKNVYKQEIFLFIPSSLHINQDTYSKKQFYSDETNIIRFKTPLISLQDLINPDYSPSPLIRLQRLFNQSNPIEFINIAADELKLFCAIFRGTLMERVSKIINELNKQSIDRQELRNTILSLCEQTTRVCHFFRQIQEKALTFSNYPQLIRYFKYADEFISMMIDEFMINLLKKYRSIHQEVDEVDRLISQLIVNENLYRKQKNLIPKSLKGELASNEAILYRLGLLQRFVLESLMLKNVRLSSEEKHRNILGAVAAGIAMFFYMTFFAMNASSLVINSFSFVFFAAFLYIIKDRIKEGFKSYYYKQAHRWFPDFLTEITSFKGYKLGKLSENVVFIKASDLPYGFQKIRNHQFHEELQALHRHETILQYKREVTLTRPILPAEARRRAVTVIFRLNVHRFLQKASNPFQSNLTFDTYTHEISERLLPKVYHLNLIIRDTSLQEDLQLKTTIRTYRVVIDKKGIKRVEKV